MKPLPRLLYSIPGSSPTALLAPKRVRQLAAMRDAGIHAYEINYPISEGWAFPGRHHFGSLDARLAHVTDIDPDAQILLRVDLHAPAFWFLQHPRDVVDYALGSPNGPPAVGGDLDTGIRPSRISLASAPWRKATGEALQALVRHVLAGAWAKHVAGIMTACCTYGEWHYWGFFHLPDTGEAMTKHFRAHVKRTYRRDLAAVSRAWGRRISDWSEVHPPGVERTENGPSSFRTGRHAAWTLDYVRCHHRLVAETLIGFCRAVKEASAGKLLTGAFHGYFFNTPWRDEGGHLEFARVLDSPWVDYLAAPQIYDVHARDLGGTGLDRALVASVLKRGKLWFSEADTPTHIGRSMKSYWKTRTEIARNADESIALVRRDAARALTGRHHLWWFDFGRNHLGGEYLHPRIMKEIAALARLAERVDSLDTSPVSQLALAYDDESARHLAHWRSGADAVSSGLRDQLAREAQYIGASSDALLWGDVEARHRAVVIAEALHLTPARRKRLQRAICRDGRHVLWMYAPGVLGSETPEGGITATTGIRVRPLRKDEAPEMTFEGDSPLLRGLRGKTFRYHPAPVWMEKDADLPAPQFIRPAFRVDDPDAEILARWSSGAVAMASKPTPWGVSIYCALPLVPRTFLRNFLVGAGGHVYSASDDVWMANRGVLAVHTRRGGKRTVRLPHEADVVDGVTNYQVAKRASSFTTMLPPRSTTIWLLLPSGG
jgi:glycosyl hydrolase family 42 (putative beta-galactosidase)